MTNFVPVGTDWNQNSGANTDPVLDAPSDEQLVRRVVRGDEQAFAQLLRRHLNAINHYLYRLTASRADADELCQETFLLLWRKAATFQPGRVQFSTWLHRIAHNRFVDYIRKAKRAGEIERPMSQAASALDRTSDPNGAPETIRRTDEMRQHLHTALRALPANQRDAILLCHQQGLSNREAAIVLGVGARALESLLARARRTLRQVLEPDWGTKK